MKLYQLNETDPAPTEDGLFAFNRLTDFIKKQELFETVELSKYDDGVQNYDHTGYFRTDRFKTHAEGGEISMVLYLTLSGNDKDGEEDFQVTCNAVGNTHAFPVGTFDEYKFTKSTESSTEMLRALKVEALPRVRKFIEEFGG